MIVYHGFVSDGEREIIVSLGGYTQPLPPVRIHTMGENCYSWGYPGSGPATAALSILAFHFGEKPERIVAWHNGRRSSGWQSLAWQYHQRFKDLVVAHFPIDGGWTLTDLEVNGALSKIDQET